MRTTFKTLLLTSAMALSLSACAGHHNHAKNNPPCEKDGKCMVSEKIQGLSDKMEVISKDVRNMNKDMTDPVAKEQAKKAQKDLAEVAAGVKEVQKSVDHIVNGDKKKHKKAAAADAKPADKKADAHKK